MSDQGKGFFGNLASKAKGVLYEDENPTPVAQPAVVNQPTAPSAPASVVSGSGTTSFVSGVHYQVNPEIKGQLDQAVAEANQQSYTEFLNYLDAMSTALAGKDEETRYRAALAASAKKGFTPQEIIRGIDAILQVLQSEERNFTQAVSQRIAEKVGSRESELANIEARIAENNNKIAELQTQNSELNSRKRVAADEIRSEKQKVEDRKRVFTDTVAAETRRYNEEKQRVLSYAGRAA